MYYADLNRDLFDSTSSLLARRYEDQRNAFFAKGINNFGDHFNPIDISSNQGGIGGLAWLNPMRIIAFLIVGVIVWILVRKLKKKNSK